MEPETNPKIGKNEAHTWLGKLTAKLARGSNTQNVLSDVQHGNHRPALAPYKRCPKGRRILYLQIVLHEDEAAQYTAITAPPYTRNSLI